jgi:signal transduction histidine kinase
VALSSGNLDHRVKAVNQVREVQTLADTFDSMALRIQTLIRDMREMTDNIAHDLRSPLGRIRLLAESVKNSNDLSPEVSDCAQKTMGECDRLIAMINTALDVAEAEAGVHHGPRTLEDFTALVVDTWDLFEASAEQNANRVSTRLVSGAFVQGQRTALQRMLSNLFDNAIKYTPAGGQINIEILHDDQDTGLLIRNTCNGIADGDQEKIFDRFQRLEPSRGRSGCGLGLSYSRAVARSHGGDIHIKSDKQSYVELIVKLPSAVTQHYPFNPQLIS